MVEFLQLIVPTLSRAPRAGSGPSFYIARAPSHGGLAAGLLVVVVMRALLVVCGRGVGGVGVLLVLVPGLLGHAHGHAVRAEPVLDRVEREVVLLARHGQPLRRLLALGVHEHQPRHRRLLARLRRHGARGGEQLTRR